MKFVVFALIALGITGCDFIPGGNKDASTGCMNHANAIATDAELQMMRTGYGGQTDVIMTMHNCRYYFFNPEAKTNPQGLTKDDIQACEGLRPQFHEAASQLKQQALSVCLGLN